MTGAFVAAFTLAVALAMDAFAVELTQGAKFKPGWRHAAAIALAFGAFQGIMPLVGWLIGSFALSYIQVFDHWIAFLLLAYLGVQMIRETVDETAATPLAGATLLIASVATSIDALAAGLTLPTLGVDPLLACALIAAITVVLSFAAVLLGRRAGDRFGRPAEIIGGLLLIAIGGTILFDHLSAA